MFYLVHLVFLLFMLNVLINFVEGTPSLLVLYKLNCHCHGNLMQAERVSERAKSKGKLKVKRTFGVFSHCSRLLCMHVARSVYFPCARRWQLIHIGRAALISPLSLSPISQPGVNPWLPAPLLPLCSSTVHTSSLRGAEQQGKENNGCGGAWNKSLQCIFLQNNTRSSSLPVLHYSFSCFQVIYSTPTSFLPPLTPYPLHCSPQ